MEKKQGEERHEGLRQALKAFSVLGGIGIYLVVFVGICVFLGNLADEKLGLGYMGKLVGILIGFPGALYTLYRQLKQGELL
ncbi:Putative F0F1-ATPase subunit Ca2+/Mg2+ transporter [Selenomonas sp. WCT3]|uniref:AtpZ/AtpI family protein n=1 Tax=unclassified Selenomonas TaxID=2637378 RepID=UPI00088FFD35|nr:AtpZ/AtpI family protein [Selenomonas sp.]MCR5440141.1 AtpZ/AtpI family protein [Selenomonas sp.]SDG12783.1 Putative F0F1-ATPase subunit Ca2+/Mg2+ transporter [Selenomonas ruminantium]